MIMDDSVVKDYLRIDTDENIGLYIDAAEDYFKGAIGRDPSTDRALDCIAVCAITQRFYDKRTMTADKPMKDELDRMVSSVFYHLRLELLPDGGDDDDV